MALMISAGELPYKPMAAIFADTGDEPKAVYDWLDWLEPLLAFPVYRVQKTGGESLSQASLRPRLSKKSGKWYFKFYAPTFSLNPDGTKGMLPRKCTTDFKIVPIQQMMRRLANVKRGTKVPVVRSLIGISTDEASRMRTSREPWIENHYPLIEAGLSRNDCLRWMADNKLPTPPKSACVFCPYHSDKTWQHLKDNDPSGFEAAARFEEQLQALQQSKEAAVGVQLGKEFLHSSRKPLREVEFVRKDQPNSFENECEGLCGV